MIFQQYLKKATLTLFLLSINSWANANFNQVVYQVSTALQNAHYSGEVFDDEKSEQCFDQYFEILDPRKIYFLQSDYDAFAKKYRIELDNRVRKKKGADTALEIHRVFLERVNNREEFIRAALEKAYSFDSEKTILITRKDASFPKNKAEWDELWSKQVEDQLLDEIMRRELIAKIAKEQGKENPLENKLTPQEVIKNRYMRITKLYRERTSDEVVDLFLTALSLTYDPHTDYFSETEFEGFSRSISGSLIGIGALLSSEEDGTTKIEGIVNGGPADKQGQLALNDKIVAVDSLGNGKFTDIMFMPISRVVDLITGEENTKVSLKVEAAEPIGMTKLITIVRKKIEMEDKKAKGEIIYKKVGDETQKIGWIDIPSFYADFQVKESGVSYDVEKILDRMVKEEVDGLVVDLRNNGGGSLEEVRRMTGFFVDRGPVVQIKDYLDRTDSKYTSRRKALYTGPLVIATNKFSASASEILAGAIQDYNRGIVVGEESTFGKGTVQQLVEVARLMPLFSDKSKAGYLKPTIQKYYRVTGNSTQQKGVEADIVLPAQHTILEYGERFLDNSLAFDTISPAKGFNPLDRSSLPIEALTRSSETRIATSIDFQYTQEDIDRQKEMISKNTISLNKATRLKLTDEGEARRHVRNEERRERFTTMQKADDKVFTFYRAWLNDLEKVELPLVDREHDSEENMRRADDKVGELNDTPEFPSGLDPIKREALEIISDFISINEDQVALLN